MVRVVLGRGGTRDSARMYPLPRYFLGEIRFPAPANRDTWPRSVTRAGTASEEGVSRAEDSEGMGNDSQRSLSLVARNSTRAFLEFPGSSGLRRGYKFCTHISMETTIVVAGEEEIEQIDIVETIRRMADS